MGYSDEERKNLRYQKRLNLSHNDPVTTHNQKIFCHTY